MPKKSKKLPKRLLEELTERNFICVGKIENSFQDTIIAKITVDYVPKFGGILHLENRKQIGKVYEIFGGMRKYKAAAKILKSLHISDYPNDTKVFMTGDFLIPLIKYVPVEMRENFLYTPQESDCPVRKRKKPPKYVPIPESDGSGPGYDYTPPGSDGRVYIAEGPYAKIGILGVRGTPMVPGGLPPYHAKPNQVIRGRGSFYPLTLPPVGSFTHNIQPTTINQSTEYQPAPVRYSQSDFSDIISNISQTNTSEYYQAAAAPQLQPPVYTQPQEWTPYTASYTQTSQMSQAFAGASTHTLDESFSSISIGHSSDTTARTEDLYYQPYNRGTTASEEASGGGYAIRGRAYNPPQAQYYEDSSRQYPQVSYDAYNQGFSSTYNTAPGGLEASSSHAGYGMPYRPPSAYPVQQGQYNQPMYDNFNRGIQREPYSNEPPARNIEGNWRDRSYQQRPENYPDPIGHGDRGRGFAQNFRGRGRAAYRGPQRGGYRY